MQSLRSEPFSKLIPLLPVNKHAVRVKALNWQKHFYASRLKDDFHEIFGSSEEIRLTRGEIRNQRQDRRKSIEILLWGYPSGMRGNHHIDYLKNIQNIASNAASDSDWPGYFTALNSIGSLGISTVTKLAYFFSRSFGGYQALILDNRLIGVISHGGWDELRGLKRLTYQNAVRRYENYLKVMTDAANGIHGVDPADLEFFLFTLGDAFKQN